MLRQRLVQAVAVAGLSGFAAADCVGKCIECDGGSCGRCADGYKKNDGADAAETPCIASCTPANNLLPPAPDTPFQYAGKAHPAICIDRNIGRFFGIGDWGGSVPGGGTWTNPGKCQGTADMMKLQEASNYTRDYDEFLTVFNKESEATRNEWPWGYPPRRRARPPLRHCDDVDHWAQKYVANQMIAQAGKNEYTDFVLNAGDNFYPGGINTQCGQFGSDIPWDPSNQFMPMWHDVYLKENLATAPWISCLGNHDYGGRSHHTGWDYQVFFTWKHTQWTMPAQYYTQLIQYRDFSIKVFVMDSNYLDCCTDYNHRICQGGGDCFGFNDGTCVNELNTAWGNSVDMLADGLANSTSDWHFIVTHFPAPSLTGQPRIKQLDTDYGIDLVFTGHAHYQGLTENNGMWSIISGGGGGVTTDAANCEFCNGYGYVNFEITATYLNIQMLNWNNHLNEEQRIAPKLRKNSRLASEKAQFV